MAKEIKKESFVSVVESIYTEDFRDFLQIIMKDKEERSTKIQQITLDVCEKIDNKPIGDVIVALSFLLVNTLNEDEIKNVLSTIKKRNQKSELDYYA